MKTRRFFGGAALPHHKYTSNSVVVPMGVPARVTIPMLQHMGAPCEPLVVKGDAVKAGQLIGDTAEHIAAPVHSSVSGTVEGIFETPHPGGGNTMSVTIRTDGLQETHESVRPKTYASKEGFLSLVRQSGLVGLGGAGFPTHVKLAPPPGVRVDCLIINGAECEPYVTSDERMMVERAGGIAGGVRLILDALGIPRARIGVGDGKPAAIKAVKEAIAGDRRIDLTALRSRYPQGAEKMLIYACTGRRVPPGKLPHDVNAVVLNVSSVAAVYDYMTTGMPLIKKIVTVSGSAVKTPANVEVLIGTPLSEVFGFCGGFKSPAKKIVMGGPMMGVAQFTPDAPVIKNTNAILAFDERDAAQAGETSCIRCGRCADSCPMRLLPLYINGAAVKNDAERLKKYRVGDCIECGACEYDCPAKRRIVQSARLGKQILLNA